MFRRRRLGRPVGLPTSCPTLFAQLRGPHSIRHYRGNRPARCAEQSFLHRDIDSRSVRAARRLACGASLFRAYRMRGAFDLRRFCRGPSSRLIAREPASQGATRPTASSPVRSAFATRRRTGWGFYGFRAGARDQDTKRAPPRMPLPPERSSHPTECTGSIRHALRKNLQGSSPYRTLMMRELFHNS